jgi:hypoxanthine phosphoribosyltransferase
MWMPKSRNLTLAKVVDLSRQLSERVRMYQIDLVVSIEKGGWFVGDVISHELNVPHLQITIGRLSDAEVEKLHYKNIPQPMQVMSAIHEMLTSSRMPKLQRGLVNFEPVSDKRILLVDDFIQTGRTIALAKDYLYGLWSSSIYVAALASVKGAPFPMFHALQGHYCFPWSRLSSEYEVFQDMYRRGHVKDH